MCCDGLLEQSYRVLGPPRLLVNLRRYQIVEVVVRIVLGKGLRLGQSRIYTIDLRFDPDKVALQRSVFRIAGNSVLQHGARLAKLFRRVQQS